MIEYIEKRDGRTMKFELQKIADAIFKAAQAVGGNNYTEAQRLSEQVLEILEKENNSKPTVEHVQDTVEKVLIENGHARTAKEYILYRAERTRIREMNTKLLSLRLKKEERIPFILLRIPILTALFCRKQQSRLRNQTDFLRK